MAGDSFTRLAVDKVGNTLVFSSTSRGKKSEYLIAKLGEVIEFIAPGDKLHQVLGEAQFCIEKTLERY